VLLVLASRSPRRQEILTNAGITFKVRVPNVPEELSAGESAEAYVRRLAGEKAQAVECGEDEIILSADTVVVVQGAILEKPRDQSDASRMLRLLSEREHEVLTGICLRSTAIMKLDLATTRVHFSRLTAAEIDDYVRSGEPMDKAGAYAIQGLASKFIDRIEGCYFNVVGLPIALVYGRLKELGFA
jgi:septum formation protein